MPSKETRRDRGYRQGREQLRRVVEELRVARVTNGISQAGLARLARESQSALARWEGGELADVGVIRLSEIASVLGLDMTVRLYPVGDAVRDRAQIRVSARLESLLSSAWRVTDETLLPGQGELRAWDKTLRLVGSQPRHLVGVDIESRVQDVQALVRRTRLREREGRSTRSLWFSLTPVTTGTSSASSARLWVLETRPRRR